ncbi:MAG: UvrD-helicase domain-containing protein, partial [Clostridia bacterium]|nr:UvrD-helicase domain-containing protein [Clostridia bacterium]
MQETPTKFLSLRRAIMEKEYERMNPEQRRAVFSTQGPLLILAGAGSGKTTVLVNRVACILKYGEAYGSSKVPEGLNDDDIAFLDGCLATGD